MKFMYKGRVYNPVNVEKKLKKMGITINDIDIIKEELVEEPSFVSDIRLFYYYNPTTGYSITSIYDNVNENGYERIDKRQLDKIIKCRQIFK